MSSAHTPLLPAAGSVRGRLVIFLIAAVVLIILISLSAVAGLTQTYGGLRDLRDRTLGQMSSSMTLGVKTAQISTYATRLTQTIGAMEYREESRLLAEQADALQNLLQRITPSGEEALSHAAHTKALRESTDRLSAGVQELLLQTHHRHVIHTAILSHLHQMMLDVRHIRRIAERNGAPPADILALTQLNELLETAAQSRFSTNTFALVAGEFMRLADPADFAGERAALHDAFAQIRIRAAELEETHLRITFLLYRINALVKNINSQYTDLVNRQVLDMTLASTRIQEKIYRNILAVLGFSLLTILIIAISGRYIYAAVGRRLYSIIAALKELSQGNRGITVPQQQRQDEIGDLARAFNIFHQNVILLEETDRQLKEKSEWLEQTFLSMRDGLAIFDRQHNIISCNNAFRALLPGFFDPDDSVRNLRDLAHYFRAHQAVSSLDRTPVGSDTLGIIRLHEEAFEIECGGRIFEWRTSPLQDGMVAFLIDRTERRRLETDLAHSRKMHTIGHITGGIAHDFNNLLAVIIGNLDMVDMQTLTEKQEKYLRRAMQAAENSATLTQRLLAYARKQPLHPGNIDTARLIIGVQQLVKHTLPPGIRFTLDISDPLPPVYMDKNQLETALVNLIVNAKDAVGSSGHICIRARPCLVKRKNRRENMVQISVTDDGCGMDEDTRARAFEPFFTTKTGGKGSGLGLSMVYGFIRQSKGRVLIESAPGQGTTIHLQLPLAQKNIPAAHSTPDSSADKNSAQGSILLVEDQDALRETLREQLHALGYEVSVCADTDSALAHLARHPDTDHLLSDIVLPGSISGVQLAEQARQTHPALRIVLMTGHYAELGQSRIPFTVLKKPFSHKELQRALHGTAEQARTASPQ